jgi:hypothetical protein
MRRDGGGIDEQFTAYGRGAGAAARVRAVPEPASDVGFLCGHNGLWG